MRFERYLFLLTGSTDLVIEWVVENDLIYYHITTLRRESYQNPSTHARKYVHERYRSYYLANMHVCVDGPV